MNNLDFDLSYKFTYKDGTTSGGVCKLINWTSIYKDTIMIAEAYNNPVIKVELKQTKSNVK